jgi:signal transduction histidine kinase/ActR/RegA family two-component response regulator
MRARRARPLGLQVTIPGAIVAAVLLTAVVTMLAALLVARSALHAKVLEIAQESARGYAIAVDLYLRSARDALEAAAARPLLRGALAAADGVRAERVRAALAAIARTSPAFEHVALIDPAGSVIALEPLELERSQLRPDRGYAVWFQQAVRERRTVVSDLVLSVTTGHPTVVIATPLLHDGQQLVGVLAGALRLAELSRLGPTSRRPSSRYGLLTDRRGLVIAHEARPEYVRYQTDLTALAPVRAALAGTAGAGRFRDPLTRTEQFGAWVPMPGTGWAILQVEPVAAAFAPIERLSRVLGWTTAAVAVLLGGLAFAYVRPLVSRIHELAARAERISMGGAGGAVPVAARRDELDQLAAAFNRMSAGLAARDEALRARLDELARANRRLAQANEAKDRFVAMLGHELRNPLGAIASAAEVLRLVGSTDDTASRSQEIIARQVGHLTRMVDDLLDASHLASGRVVLQREPVNLAECVTRALAALRTSRLAGHQVTWQSTAAWVKADATRLEQVATNLLVNAVKYTPVGGRIAVSVAAEDDWAVLQVADDGIGIPADLLPRVFDLFVQGDREPHRSPGGLGLGLTVVRRLVELHGGRVEARSEGPGTGACFTVRLLRIAAPADCPPEAPAVLAGPPRRVLIVEDNADAREMLRRWLELAGHDVRVAVDGPSGVAAALASAPDVALIDLGLPGLDGYEVARRIRASAPGAAVRLVAVTGYGQQEDRARAHAAGFDAHLVKPVDVAQLADVLGLAAAASGTGPPP